MEKRMINAYMKTAKIFAELSYSHRLKVGAIIVKDNRILSIGYNGTPSGWVNTCEDENNITKKEVIHAEANCLAKMAKANESSNGGHMFLTHSPCFECAKQIYAAGISHVYYSDEYRLTDGLDFLRQCGVKVEKI